MKRLVFDSRFLQNCKPTTLTFCSSTNHLEITERIAPWKKPIKLVKFVQSVSNFSPDRFIDLQHFVEIKPAVNQNWNPCIFQQQKVQEVLENTSAKSNLGASARMQWFLLTHLFKGNRRKIWQVQRRLPFVFKAMWWLFQKSVHKERMQREFQCVWFWIGRRRNEEHWSVWTKNLFFWSSGSRQQNFSHDHCQ